MTPRDLDALLEALQWDARARGADRLTLDLDDRPCARCWREDAVLHRRPIDWRVFGPLARRAVIEAGLDPWQFKRPQVGAAKGGWSVAVEGETVQARRVTFRPTEPRRAPDGSEGRADATLRALEQQVAAATEIEEVAAVATAEDVPLVKLANLVLRDAHVRDARRITASVEGGELTYADGTTEHRFRWPAELWPDLRRRWLHMAQLDPWERGPAMAYLHLRIAADDALWTLEVVPEGQGRVVMNLASVERAADRSGPRPPAPGPPPLDPGLAAVLDAPGDLARRGVWADVLLERGDPRGRFINLQLSGRATGPPPPESVGWCGALRSIPGEVRFAWGFVDRVVLSGTGVRADWDAIVRDPHWATVRGLKLGHPRPDAGARILAEARLSSIEALMFAVAPAHPVAPAVLARLTALGVVGMNDRTARWVEGQALPNLRLLELALDDDLTGDAVAQFFAFAATRPVTELVIDARAHAEVGPRLGALPPRIERVTLAPPDPLGFSPAVACTLRRPSPGAPLGEAVVHADVDALYRGAPDAFRWLAAVPSLAAVRLVAGDRALDRGRLAVLKRAAEGTLGGIRLEAEVGPPAARLWWQAETPAR